MTLRKYAFSILLIFFLSINLFGLTVNELKIETAKTYKDLTLQDWKDKSDYRAITRRSQFDFDNLIPMYIEKIGAIREQLHSSLTITLTPIVDGKLKTPLELGNELMEEIQYLLDKETRLIDKFATCVKEVEMRKDGDVARTNLHDATPIYIDFDGGDDTNGGEAFGDAWKTLNKYTTETIRTAGDVAYVRAGTTLLQSERDALDIAFDEDGDKDNYISIIGCDSVTNDPWSDSSDTLPIIDFEDASYQMKLSSDRWWWLERLDLRQTIDTSGLIGMLYGHHDYFKNCNFQDVGAVNSEGIQISVSEDVVVDGCTFTDCWSQSISCVNGSSIEVIDCTFTAGVDVGTDYGISGDAGVYIYMRDSTFVATFDVYDVLLGNGSTIYARNVNWSGKGFNVVEGSAIYSEDDDGTFESHITTLYMGTITRGTASPRSGGADSFAIMASNANCGPTKPLLLGDKLSGAFKIWIATNAASTITVYARVDSAWDNALTAAECYIKASYLDSAGDSGRTILQSTEQIANNTDWTALTVTIPASNPKRDGWVYIWFYLEEYEDASEKVDVDIKPVVS